MYPNEQNPSLQMTSAHLFAAVLFTISETRKQPETRDGGLGEEDVRDEADRYRYGYGCSCSYRLVADSAIKKEVLPFVTTWMDLEDSMTNTV